MQEELLQNGVFFVFKRLMSHYQLKNQSALARFLDIKPSYIPTLIKRESIPYEQIITKCSNCDLNWIFYGESQKTSDFSCDEVKNDQIEVSTPTQSDIEAYLKDENIRLQEKVSGLMEEQGRLKRLVEELSIKNAVFLPSSLVDQEVKKSEESRQKHTHKP
jgi:hypothetical protein